MASALGLDLAGIHNVGEFYSNHYLTTLLEGDLKDTLKRWADAEKDGGPKTPDKRLAALANKFFTWQAQAAGHTQVEPRLEPARELLDGILSVQRHQIRERREQGRVSHLLGRHAALGPLVPSGKYEAQRPKTEILGRIQIEMRFHRGPSPRKPI